MQQFNKELKQKREKLQKIKDNVTVDRLKDLNLTIKVIDQLLTKYPNQKTNYPDIFLEEYEFLKNYKFLWEICNTISEFTSDEMRSYCWYEHNLKNKELLELSNDFFKNATNKEIYELFLKLYKQNKNIHFVKLDKNSSFKGESTFLLYDKSFYLQLQREYDFSDISTLIHEFGHGIQFLLNYNYNLFLSQVCFSEISSIFFELLSMEYFSKDSFFKRDAITAEQSLWDDSCENALSLTRLFQVFESIDLNEWENKNIIKKKLTNYLLEYNIDSLLNEMPSHDFPYVISYSIANELYLMYLNDPEESFYIYKKIMAIDLKLPPDKYLDEIINLGVLPTENLDKYEKVLKRKLV